MKYIFIGAFLFCSADLHAQSYVLIDTLSLCYSNGITYQTNTINSYRITNNTNEEYLTWVSLAPTNSKSKIGLIRDFFLARKGDFSFMEMMYEKLLCDQSISIGYSFIKKIAIGETFSYFITKSNPFSMFYQDRIVVIRRREVEQYLRVNIDDSCFFQPDFIVLTE